MNKKILTYITVIILSAVLLFFWNSYALDGAEIFGHSVKTQRAQILSIEGESATTVANFSSTLLLCTYADSAADIFNREFIAYEVLQAVA